MMPDCIQEIIVAIMHHLFGVIVIDPRRSW